MENRLGRGVPRRKGNLALLMNITSRRISSVKNDRIQALTNQAARHLGTTGPIPFRHHRVAEKKALTDLALITAFRIIASQRGATLQQQMEVWGDAQ